MHITSGTKPPGVFARYGVPLSLASGSRRSRLGPPPDAAFLGRRIPANAKEPTVGWTVNSLITPIIGASR